MKILTISSLYPSSVQPSFGVFVENRLRHLLVDTDIEARVIAPVPWFPFKHRIFGRYALFASTPKRERLHGIEVYHPRFFVIPKIGARFTPFFLAYAIGRQIRHLIREGYVADLFDAHYLYPDGVAVAKVARLFGKPFVMTARGSDVTEIGRIPAFQAMILDAARRCSHIIAVSRSLAEELKTFGADTPITTLRNGVDPKRFHIAETGRDAAKAEENGRFKILFAGWLIPRKRVDLVLGAAAEIPEADVIIAGDGPEEPRLRALARQLGIADRVSFLGRQAPDDMPALYGGADILMLPSEREGWANVLLEAMACGTPVISSAVAGALDLVTVPTAGRLVARQEVGAYAEAIRDVMGNPPSRAAVRDFARQFDWQDISHGQIEIFERAVSEFRQTTGGTDDA